MLTILNNNQEAADLSNAANVTDEKIRINFGGNPFGDLAVYAEPASYGGRVDYSF